MKFKLFKKSVILPSKKYSPTKLSKKRENAKKNTTKTKTTNQENNTTAIYFSYAVRQQ